MGLVSLSLISRTIVCLVSVSALALACAAAQAAEAPDTEVAFAEAVAALNAQSFDGKAAAAEVVAASGHARAALVLNALLGGDLYRERRGERRVVIAEAIDGGYRIAEAATGDALGETGRRGVRKVTVNNQLRRHLRGLIAGMRLDHPNAEERIAAARAIAEADDASLGEMLRQHRGVEQDAGVVAAIDAALVVFDLDAESAETRLAAIGAASEMLDSGVRRKLTALAEDESEAAQIRSAATGALADIEQRAARFETIETIFFGISLGSILVLAAIGLSITFGVMGVINMAHGELIMLGAYTTYVVQTAMVALWGDVGLATSLFVAIPAAFGVAGLVGVAIERGVIRFLYGRPLETLLATFGVSLILQQAVRSIFSPLNRAVATPDWMSGSWQVAQGLSVTYNRLYTLIFAGLVFAALLAVLQRTRLGLEVRATMQNRPMAQAMGIRTARVDALTFGLGAGIAGVAGVALSQLTNVGPNLGQAYIVDSFLVVVFGGVGNLWGTLVAGLSLGVANKFLEPVTGAVVAKIVVLVFIILFIQKRPRGLFPQRGRAAEG